MSRAQREEVEEAYRILKKMKCPNNVEPYEPDIGPGPFLHECPDPDWNQDQSTWCSRCLWLYRYEKRRGISPMFFEPTPGQRAKEREMEFMREEAARKTMARAVARVDTERWAMRVLKANPYYYSDEQDPICPKCGKEAERSMTKHGVRHDCCGLWSWGGKALVDEATHEARKAAHLAFDRLWQHFDIERNEAYHILAEELGVEEPKAHMAVMSAELARRVPAAVARIKTRLNKERWGEPCP